MILAATFDRFGGGVRAVRVRMDRGAAAGRRLRARRRRSAGPDRYTSNQRWLLREVDEVLGARPDATVAVLANADASDDEQAFSRALTLGYPSADVLCVPVPTPAPSLHVRLAAGGPFAAIVVTAELARDLPDLATLYREVVFHLAPAGRLFVGDLHPGRTEPEGLWPLLSRLVALREAPADSPGDGDDRALSNASRQVTVNGRRLAVTNHGQAFAKLREDEVDEVLRLRGPRMGRIIEQIAPDSPEPRGTIHDWGAEPGTRVPTAMPVPGCRCAATPTRTACPGRSPCPARCCCPTPTGTSRRAGS